MIFSPVDRLEHLRNWHVQSSEPAGTQGAVWVDTSNVALPVMKVFLSGEWRTIAGGGEADGVFATVSQTLPALSQSAGGTVTEPVSGDVTQTLSALTQSATGAVTAGAGTVSGAVTQTLPALSQALAGDVSAIDAGLLIEAGNSLTTEAGDRLLLEEAADMSGDISQTLPALGQDATGTVEAAGGGESTDFSEYTTGVAPADWTEGTAVLEVKDDGSLIGGKWLNARGAGATSPRVGLWDTPGQPGDVEVLAKLRTQSAQVGACLRTASSSDNYHVYLPDGFTPRLRKRVGNNYTQIADLGGSSVVGGTWYWVRFRANGTTLQARVWADGDAEPSSWQADETDSSFASGFLGVWTNTNSATDGCDYFSYALDGATAP